MKKALVIRLNFMIALLLMILVVACGTEKDIPSSAPTASAIFTSTPKDESTVRSTNTPVPTLAHTEAATNTCSISDGTWQSIEETDMFFKISPLLIFKVVNCRVTFMEISAFPTPEELFWFPFKNIDIPIVKGNFGTSITNPVGGTGDFTIQGTFNDISSSHGVILFPKGFNVVDYVLKDDISINWTASPIK